MNSLLLNQLERCAGLSRVISLCPNPNLRYLWTTQRVLSCGGSSSWIYRSHPNYHNACFLSSSTLLSPPALKTRPRHHHRENTATISHRTAIISGYVRSFSSDPAVREAACSTQSKSLIDIIIRSPRVVDLSSERPHEDYDDVEGAKVNTPEGINSMKQQPAYYSSSNIDQKNLDRILHILMDGDYRLLQLYKVEIKVGISVNTLKRSKQATYKGYHLLIILGRFPTREEAIEREKRHIHQLLQNQLLLSNGSSAPITCMNQRAGGGGRRAEDPTTDVYLAIRLVVADARNDRDASSSMLMLHPIIAVDQFISRIFTEHKRNRCLQ